ncbi:MAG: serine protease Do [Akkermansiaceae bacterium]|jgi:serine protease Do
MKTPRTLIFTLLASLTLLGFPVLAQAQDAPVTAVESERAPKVKGFRDLQKLNREIVALSRRAQPATVALVSRDGRGSGSGVVVSEDGLILTAAHVTSSMAGGLDVIFPDGTRKTGEILGADYDRDAAMVKISEPGNYPFVELGQSEGLKRDQWTVALGHAGGFDPMRKPPVRLGRVLANQSFVVTDTAVVGGDSGGPLFDVQGKVIGIHSNIGMSLSENRHVPIDVFHDQWEKLKSGKASGTRFNNAQTGGPSPDQAMLGVQLAEGEEGVLVDALVPNSPAEKAGMQKGDLIRKINGKVVNSVEQMINLVKKGKAGDEVTIDYLREGKDGTVKVELVRYRDFMKDSDGPAENPEQKKKEEAPEEEPKEMEPAPNEEEKREPEKKERASLEELLKDAARKGERLELTPELVEDLGGMEKLMEEFEKSGGMAGMVPAGPDLFFASSLKALEPVMARNRGVTALIMVDGKPVALGTVVSANGGILTKNTETEGGKVEVKLGEKTYLAKVMKRFPQRDLALLKIDAEKLRPVRFEPREPALGSILTASGFENEPLGIGLLSVSGRAMAHVGFMGIQAGESEGGVLVARIVAGGAAAEGGLLDGDVITRFDGKDVTDPLTFGTLIRGRKAGETLKVDYLRDGKPSQATVTLKEREMANSVQSDPRMQRSLGPLSEVTSGYPDVIQHDIPLRPEMCGGPLFDLNGKCVGINVSRSGRIKTYAIPADEVMAMLQIKSASNPQPKVVKKEKSSDTLEAIKAIRASLKQIEKRLDELEKAER